MEEWLKIADDTINKYFEIYPETNADAIALAGWLAVKHHLNQKLEHLNGEAYKDMPPGEKFKPGANNPYIEAAENKLSIADKLFLHGDRTEAKKELVDAKKYIDRGRGQAKTPEDIGYIRDIDTQYAMMASKIR